MAPRGLIHTNILKVLAASVFRIKEYNDHGKTGTNRGEWWRGTLGQPSPYPYHFSSLSLVFYSDDRHSRWWYLYHTTWYHIPEYGNLLNHNSSFTGSDIQPVVYLVCNRRAKHDTATLCDILGHIISNSVMWLASTVVHPVKAPYITYQCHKTIRLSLPS